MIIENSKIKIIMIALFIILLVPFVRGELIIEFPSSIEGNAGQTIINNINFTNNYNFTIYDLKIYSNPYFSMTAIPRMLPNETVRKQMIFYSSVPLQEQSNITFYFLYNTTIVIPPQTYNVNITSGAFDPNYLEITKGSSVSWKNVDTLIHTATASDASFDSGDIMPGSSWSYTFNTIRDYNIYDKYIMFTMVLKVKNNTREELSHNSDYDITFFPYLNISYIETVLEVNLISNNYTIEWNNTAEGALSIKNNGNITAYNVTLNCEWAYFSKNNFNIEPEHTSYITYIVAPIIENSEQTGKTHEKKIFINSLNTPEQNHSIFINVPYAEIVGENLTGYMWWVAKKIFCDAYPTSQWCLTEPLIIEKNITIYEPPPENITLSHLDKQTLLTRMAEMATSEQWQNEKLHNMSNLIAYLMAEQELEKLEQKEENKKQKDLLNTNLILIYIIIFIIAASILGYVVYKKSREIKAKEVEQF